MKKLTVALVLVGLLTLPIVGLADSNGPQSNPPKPGTNTNPGLWNAFNQLYSHINMPWIFPAAVIDAILSFGTPAFHSNGNGNK